MTGSRTEFVGRNNTLPPKRPCARLSNRVGAGLDPCGAIQIAIELEDGGDREITFVLGAGKDTDEARAHLARYRSPHVTARSLAEVMHQWRRLTAAIQVETPDPTLDVLVNGWLPYQVQGAHGGATAGYYQSGGPTASATSSGRARAPPKRPRITARADRARSASPVRRGDVQHWWHPPIDRGVRTRISDDYLWLPTPSPSTSGTPRTRRSSTRSAQLLSGARSSGRRLHHGGPPTARSGRARSPRALRSRHPPRPLRFGKHGLPLIRRRLERRAEPRGHRGQGGNVWLAFFLADVLTRFAVHNRGAVGRRDGRALPAHHGALRGHPDPRGTALVPARDRRQHAAQTSTAESADRLPAAELGRAHGLVDPESAARMQSVDEHLVRRDAHRPTARRP